MSAPASLPPDCPAIHVAFTPLADENLFHWVQVGAEELGVPCRKVAVSVPGGDDAVAHAYAAAESSRLRIGVAVGRSEVVLHELHMPAGLPVLRFRMDGQHEQRCRLMGSNAARMVMHLPFRFPGEEPDIPVPEWLQEVMAAANGNGHHSPAAVPEPAEHAAPDDDLSPAEIAGIVGLVTRRLLERGIGA